MSKLGGIIVLDGLYDDILFKLDFADFFFGSQTDLLHDYISLTLLPARSLVEDLFEKRSNESLLLF